MNKNAWAVALTVGLLGAGGATQAALMTYESGGVQLVYDDDLNPSNTSPGITWAADANLFKTQYDADDTVVDQIIAAVPIITDRNGPHAITPDDFTTGTGAMTWFGAMAWVEWLGIINYGDANDWRLLSGACTYCNNTELWHLYYGIGGLSAESYITESPILTSVFTNMKNDVYWTSAELAAFNRSAWIFNTSRGFWGYSFQYNKNFAWAVRDGQIEASAAPLPGTALLVALGFGAMTLLRRVRRRIL